MAISKSKKIDLIKQYVDDLNDAKNLVVFKQSWLWVSRDSEIRRGIREQEWKYNVIRKRLFLRAIKEANYSEIQPDQLDWSAVVVYAKWDEYAPLKVINKYLKEFKKEKDWTTSFEFLWWWFDKQRKDADYVTELANIPSREELLSKLVWIFNYPLQSMASVLDQISKQKDSWSDVSQVEKKDETSTDPKESVEVEWQKDDALQQDTPKESENDSAPEQWNAVDKSWEKPE